MKHSDILNIHASNLRLLQPGIEQIEDISELQVVIESAIARKYFRPEEERQLQQWFSEFLRIRKQLWHIIEDVQLFLNDDLSTIDETHWPCCILGYCAICLLVRVDFLLVKRLASHSLVQRKLNESSSEFNYSRKQFSEVFYSVASLRKAIKLYEIMKLVHNHRSALKQYDSDTLVGEFAGKLNQYETYLDPSKKNFFNLYFNYRWYYLRRKTVILTQFALFWLLETSGRIISELHDRWTPKRVTQTIRDQLADILEPGDILLTKHQGALTNLFLPGFWPHAALYVGAIHQHPDLHISDRTREHWFGTRCVLEALKDGVHFRPLHKTLQVDAFAVVRPKLNPDQIKTGIENVAVHAGKLYNFNFDFFSSDRLVCTEVVYRAFDGLGDFQLPLKERAGRPTLSANDLMDAALDGSYLTPIACFGLEGCEDTIIQGAKAIEVLKQC